VLIVFATCIGGRRRESHFADGIQQLDVLDAQERYEEETKDRGIGALHHIRSRTRSRTHEMVIAWEHNDPENPYNWPTVSPAMQLVVWGFSSCC